MADDDGSTVTQRFHDLYWNSAIWRWTFWHGVPTLKCPLDLWIYQELLWHLRPALVIELGTWVGGTATFLADMMDLYRADPQSQVITVDIIDDQSLSSLVYDYFEKAPFPIRIRPPHPRITYISGDSVSESVLQEVSSTASNKSPVLVIADSDHSYDHTYQELLLYHGFVTPGSWFIMEDTDGPEPRAAVERFLSETSDFYVDAQCEKFFLTFNPGGYLRKR